MENGFFASKKNDHFIIMVHMSIWSAAFSLFLVYNVLGNLAFYLSSLKNFSAKKQKIILFREMVIALVILFMFGFFGDSILGFLGISTGIIGIAGGVLLFIIALTMIFPKDEVPVAAKVIHEPFIVPIAMPAMAGPGSITAVMLYSQQFNFSHLEFSLIIFLAWLPSLGIVLTASYLKDFLGEKGIIALERLGGLLICLISTQMIISGAIKIVKENFNFAVIEQTTPQTTPQTTTSAH